MSKLNPQKATAYVGPGVLRKGGKITPVPNGPLIKKKGPFKGSTLKSGGVIKKAQAGKRVPVKSVSTLTAPKGTTVDMKPSVPELTASDKIRLATIPKTKKQQQQDKVQALRQISYNNYVKDPKKGFQKAGLSFDEWNNAETERTQKNAAKNRRWDWLKGDGGGSYGDERGPKSPCKGGACSKRAGGTIKKAKAGTKVKKAMMGMGSMFKDNPIYKKTTDLRGKLGSAALGMPGMKPIVKNGNRIKKAQNGEYITQEGKNYTATKKVKTKNGPRYYQGKSPSMSFAMEIASDKARKINDSIPKAKLSPRALEMMNKKNGGKLKKAQGGLNLVDVTPKSKNDTVTKKPMQNWVNNPVKDTVSAPKVTPSNRMNSIINNANKNMKKKSGGMIKRADGSMSKRGLWDNIRANKGSGKKPTKQMLVQEKKIKAKTKK